VFAISQFLPTLEFGLAMIIINIFTLDIKEQLVPMGHTFFKLFLIKNIVSDE